MKRGRVGGACGMLLAIACTPLGLWIYDDPAVTVARVRLDPDSSAARRPSLEVSLDLRNPNDYELSSSRVELRLRLDEQAIGELASDSAVALPQGATATVALPMAADSGVGWARLLALASGMHRYHVDGRAMVVTPFGNRSVRFAQDGDLVFGPPASPPSDPDGRGGSP